MLGARLDEAASLLAARLRRRGREPLALVEELRLMRMKRHEPTRVRFDGADLEVVDAASFLSAYRAIFLGHIYRFRSAHGAPSIIDGGANIGLAVLYWKRAFPGARVHVFEPDRDVFGALRRNCGSLDGVRLEDAALWIDDRGAQFRALGGDAGRIAANATDHTATDAVRVRTVRLHDLLDKRVEMLKLDVEGAELAVLEDCAPRLANVQNVYVEVHHFVDAPRSLDRVLRILTDAGLRYAVRSTFGGARPLSEPAADGGMDERFDVFASRVAP